MDEIVLTQQDKEHMTLALEECHNRITAALKRGLEAYKMLSRELHKIESESLFLVVAETFDDWARKNLGFESRDIKRIHSIATSVTVLERAALELPSNEAQVMELGRLNPELQPVVWQKCLRINEIDGIPITSDNIRKVVDREIASAKQPPPPPKPPIGKGVDAPLDLGDSQKAQAAAAGSTSSAPAQPPKRITLTERGEKALSRLRTLCGDSLANALENGSLPLAERDIIRWGEEQDSQLVKNLVHYVSHLRWSLAKSLAYENQLVDSETTVDQLVTFARARSGRFATSHEDAKIIVEL